MANTNDPSTHDMSNNQHRNQGETFDCFETLTDRFVKEIIYYIEVYRLNPTKIRSVQLPSSPLVLLIVLMIGLWLLEYLFAAIWCHLLYSSSGEIMIGYPDDHHWGDEFSWVVYSGILYERAILLKCSSS